MKAILEKLACPVCATRLCIVENKKSGEAPTLICSHCRERFTPMDGMINLAGDAVAPGLFSAQWAMEFEPLVAVYDHLWRPVLTSMICDLKWEMETSREMMDVSSGMDVLDLACGTGNFTGLFSEPARPGAVIGADLSLPMLRNARRKFKEQKKSNIALMRVDVTKWPFAPESFDRIHCAGALHLLPDIQNVFFSIFRSLKKGGYFVGATYCWGGDYATQMIQNYASWGRWIHWFDDQELQSLSVHAGFSGWEARTYKQGIVFRIQKP